MQNPKDPKTENGWQEPQPCVCALLAEHGTSPETILNIVRRLPEEPGAGVLDCNSPPGVFGISVTGPGTGALSEILFGRTGIASGTLADRYYFPVGIPRGRPEFPVILNDSSSLPALLDIARVHGADVKWLDLYYLRFPRHPARRDFSRILPRFRHEKALRFMLLEFPEG